MSGGSPPFPASADESFSATPSMRIGSNRTDGHAPVLVWRAGSNVRRDSRSSPKNSARTGMDAEGDQASSTPPRTAYCPGSVTPGTRA